MMERLKKIKKLYKEWLFTLFVVIFMTTVCNIVGYGGSFIESIPGIIILCIISLLGLVAKELIPCNSLPVVTYIGIIGLFVAMPASPVSKIIIYWTNKIDLMASITPILAFAGVLLGKDWKAFLKIGWKGILVSMFTIFGTFFLSGWIAEILKGFTF